jgi:hypothetical protein
MPSLIDTISSDLIEDLIASTALFFDDQGGNRPYGRFLPRDWILLFVAVLKGTASFGMLFMSSNSARSLTFRRLAMMFRLIDPIKYIESSEIKKDTIDSQSAIVLREISVA